MAKAPVSPESLLEQFGPHPAYTPPGGWQDESRNPVEKLVKTHCCFCGQQCGIQLKVRGNQVIGFEPWEEFPFNHGMLCPKGVKRSHPDSLALVEGRDPAGIRVLRGDVNWDGQCGEVDLHMPDVTAQWDALHVTNQRASCQSFKLCPRNPPRRNSAPMLISGFRMSRRLYPKWDTPNLAYVGQQVNIKPVGLGEAPWKAHSNAGEGMPPPRPNNFLTL